MESRFGLRTLFEIVFVVAVVLAFIYQTNKTPAPTPAPAPPVGRYQLENAGTNEPFLVDTLTGETYTADTSLRPWRWKKVAEPISPNVKARASRTDVVNDTASRP
jgi:hypothetical protein